MGLALALAAGMIIGYAALLLLKGSPLARLEWFWSPYCVFVLWAMLSLLWSESPQIDRALTLAQVTLVSLVCAQIIAKTGDIKIIEIGFYLGLGASLLLGSSGGDEGERLGGSFGHANDLATALIGAMLFVTRRIVRLLSAPKLNIFNGALSVAIILAVAYLALYSSGSRRAIIVIALCACFILVEWAITAKTLTRKGVALVGAIGIALLSLPFVVESKFFFRLESLISYLSGGAMIREQSIGVRSGMVDYALSVWASSPFVGVGVDNFRIISPYGTYSHNNYLEILAGLGAFALILYYFPVLMTARMLSKNREVSRSSVGRQERRWLLLVGAVILISDAFSVSYYDKVSWLILATFLGYGAWLNRLGRSGLPITEWAR